mmetsp:Transcript_21815/g.60729  ORF Transcript_21815/g.60729 Transcript_21815/m.60729 type:complete len:96 (+) Transcript_21815:1871-2158(+)
MLPTCIAILKTCILQVPARSAHPLVDHCVFGTLTACDEQRDNCGKDHTRYTQAREEAHVADSFLLSCYTSPPKTRQSTGHANATSFLPCDFGTQF